LNFAGLVAALLVTGYRRPTVALKPQLRDLLWMAAGAAALLVLLVVVWRFNPAGNAAEELASQAKKIDIVDRMSVALESAAEAEKSAVLAITDEDSRAFADQARAQTGTVDQARKELDDLLRARGSQAERDLLAKFGAVFSDFQHVDDQILALAVKNTNLKAYGLAYGPAAEMLKDMEGALARLISENAASPDSARITALALGADVAALHVQSLLPPHIAEETDDKMAALEGEMARAEEGVRDDLDALAALPSVAKSSNFAAASAAWAHYEDLKVRILALSHENTNVLSLALSLTRKRQVTAACQAALMELRDAIKAEPIAGVSYGRPAMPR
jgi:hypothetical protein